MRPEDKKQYKNTEAYESVANLLTSLAESTDDINALLRSVAEYYDADRGYVFEITADGKAVDNTYEWCREGVTAEINNLQNVPIESVEVWIREFKKNGAFYISSLDTDVEKSSLTYEVLEPQGIDSLITAPLYKGKEISGFVGIDNPHKNTNDLLILKTAASIIYSDIRRTIAEKKEKEVAESLQNRFFAGTFLNTFESAYYINLEENTFVMGLFGGLKKEKNEVCKTAVEKKSFIVPAVYHSFEGPYALEGSLGASSASEKGIKVSWIVGLPMDRISINRASLAAAEMSRTMLSGHGEVDIPFDSIEKKELVAPAGDTKKCVLEITTKSEKISFVMKNEKAAADAFAKLEAAMG